MQHLDLFSGIGGFALAASWVWGDEHELVSFCDNDKASQIVLAKHWPGVPIHDDIKTLDATKWRGSIDLVSGGFPCQPFSCAGKRRGAADDRYLWPEMLRVIAECKPRWVLGENVAGIVNMELDRVCADLEGEGYEVWPLVIPACAVDAPHRRDRVWIVAHDGRGGNESFGVVRVCHGASGEVQGESRQQRLRTTTCNRREAVADAGESRLPDGDAGAHRSGAHGKSTRSDCGSTRTTWPTEPNVGRVANGVPYRVHRLRLLGNAIVPQVAEQIFRAMKAVDE